MIRRGIGVQSFVSAGGAAPTDADAQAFFDRVTTAGGTLSTLEKDAVNQLVLDMKSYSIWSKMKAIYPMVGASAAACAQNLKSSSFTGSFSTGWTFASTGVTPNGTSAYMDSGLVPSSQLTANSTHISYYSRTNTTTNNGVELGAWDTIYNNGLELATYRNSIYITDKTYSFLNSTSGRISAGSQNSQAFFIASRTASNNAFVKRNNTTIGTLTTTTTTALSSNNIYLGGSNDFGTPASYSTKECAFSSIGDGLTDTQAADFYTCVNTFQVSLSRNV